jgi:MoaA/NifB/PqqE/SkfB family radical SAM enzyme
MTLAKLARMNAPLKGFRAYANWALSNYERRFRRSRIRARPLKLVFDPTNVCQLRCPLCPTGLQIHDRKNGHARFEMLERLLDQVGDYVFFMDFFNWGEPLLNTHVEDFIQLASSRKIVCAISTNLSLPLTNDRIRRLVTCGLHEIIVSVDGASNETYEVYRKGGRFELVCENMRRLVREKRQLGRTTPVITWQFLVFRFNEHEIETAKAMAAEIGVDRIVFPPALLELDRYPLSDADKETMSGWVPVNSLLRSPPVKPAVTCDWHYMSAAINWDGAVAPCCTVSKKQDDFGTIGEHGEHSYMGVQNNSTYRGIRDRFARRPMAPTGLVCENCPTPGIMNFHRHMNRQIVLFTVAGVVGAMGRRLALLLGRA